MGEYQEERTAEIREYFANDDLYGRRELNVQTLLAK